MAVGHLCVLFDSEVACGHELWVFANKKGLISKILFCSIVGLESQPRFSDGKGLL